MTRPRRPIQPDILAIWLALGLAWVLVWVCAFAALAQSTHAWNHETHVTIQETTQPGAVAEVVFLNSNIHTQLAEQFDLTLGDLTVTVLFERDVDMDASDRFTVIPPAGFIAYPESLVVPENGAGRILILELGMM